jgi:hypothetical protein
MDGSESNYSSFFVFLMPALGIYITINISSSFSQTGNIYLVHIALLYLVEGK